MQSKLVLWYLRIILHYDVRFGRWQALAWWIVDSKGLPRTSGCWLSCREMRLSSLKNAEFIADGGNKYGEAGAMVYSPFWRTDIELLRISCWEVKDYTALTDCRVICQSCTLSQPDWRRIETKNSTPKFVASWSECEVLTYSFVHERVLKNSEQDLSRA